MSSEQLAMQYRKIKFNMYIIFKNKNKTIELGKLKKKLKYIFYFFYFIQSYKTIYVLLIWHI